MITALLLFGLSVTLWIASEVSWAKINNPNGKFTCAGEYLAIGRTSSRVFLIYSGTVTGGCEVFTFIR